MRKYIAPLLLVSVLGACNTVRGVGSDVASVADAFDPNRTYAACGTYGSVDKDGDGRITRAEYDMYRTGAYGFWDTNRDGRVSRAEYANCWYGGGFYTNYNRANYQTSYGIFDANGDGYLSADEYYSASAYPGLDTNGDGVIDSSEWRW